MVIVRAHSTSPTTSMTARVALATSSPPSHGRTPIIGATKPHHLEDTVASCDLELTDDEATQLCTTRRDGGLRLKCWRPGISARRRRCPARRTRGRPAPPCPCSIKTVGDGRSLPAQHLRRSAAAVRSARARPEGSCTQDAAVRRPLPAAGARAAQRIARRVAASSDRESASGEGGPHAGARRGVRWPSPTARCRSTGCRAAPRGSTAKRSPPMCVEHSQTWLAQRETRAAPARQVVRRSRGRASWRPFVQTST